MSAGALLHRYCPDHTPERALCGLPLIGAEEVAERDVAGDPRPACVVCDDLSPQACEDACLGAKESGIAQLPDRAGRAEDDAASPSAPRDGVERPY